MIPIPLRFLEVTEAEILLAPSDSLRVGVRASLLGKPAVAVSACMVSTPSFQPLLHNILLFDGECPICNSSNRFVVNRDPRRDTGMPLFMTGGIASSAGQAALARIGFHPPGDDGLGSVLLITPSGQVLTESAAVLSVLRQLRWPWPLLGLLGWPIPSILANSLYQFIGKRRLQISAALGIKVSCPIKVPQRLQDARLPG